MAEYVMLHFIRFENRSVIEAPACALALLKQTRLAPYLPTEEECTNSIGRLCRRGLTEIVDLPTLKRVRAQLSTFEGIGPTGGLPCIGELDFVLEGAETCRAILNSERSDKERDHFWFHTCAFIYRRNAIKLIGYDLNQMLHEVKCCEFVPVGRGLAGKIAKVVE
jgi:hypothetical protein